MYDFWISSSWNYRAQHDKVNRFNRTNKTSYYEKRLNLNKSSNTVTDSVRGGKGDTNNIKLLPPRILNHNSKAITSVREIANIANYYFIEKIQLIRYKFSINSKVKPMDVLKELIPRVEDKLRFSPVKISEVRKLFKI